MNKKGNTVKEEIRGGTGILKKFLPIIMAAMLVMTNVCVPVFAATAQQSSTGDTASASQNSGQTTGTADGATGESTGTGTSSDTANGDQTAGTAADGQTDVNANDPTGLGIAAESAVLINARTGQILYEKEKDKKQFPASTTKVMTALLTLENKKDLSEVVTISHNASFTEGSRIYLLEGEKVTIEQLLYAMLLESANDAAIALAEAVGGSIDNFAAMMNERAKELGAKNTHFETPNGLPNDAHVTSAYDLALFAQEAMKNETFRKIVSTTQYDIPGTELQPEVRHLHNTNKLLASTSKVTIDGVRRPCKYDGAIGIKTGYTKAAQSCLVAGAERDGMEVIGVILKSTPESQYPDMIKLLDHGFNNYKSVKLCSAGDEVGDIPVISGSKKSVKAVVDEDIYVSAKKDGSDEPDASEFTYKLDVSDMQAPFEGGEPAGTVTVYQGDTALGTYDVFTADSVSLSAGKNFLNSMKNIHIPVFMLGVVFVIVVIAVYLGFALKVRRENRRARAARSAKREERRRQEAEYEAQQMNNSDNILSGYYKSKQAEMLGKHPQRMPGEKNIKNGLQKK